MQPASKKTGLLLGALALVALWLLVGIGTARADGFDDADQTLDEELLEDGRLDITVAYGFQQSHGSTVVPLIGPVVQLVSSFELDRAAINKNVSDLERALLAKDPTFKKTVRAGETVYETTVKRGARVIPVRVNVIYPTGRDSVDRLKGQFLAALKSSDAIIYDGHSRGGGGFPDFDRPVLGHGKIFEESTLGGHWSGVGKHPFNRFKKQVLAVVSCESDQYYHGMLRNKIEEKDSATLALILTKHPGYNEDLAPTSAALIGGLMSGEQPEHIMDSMEQAAKNYYGGEFDPTMPPLFSEDGFVKRWVPAPGWPPKWSRGVVAEPRDSKTVTTLPPADLTAAIESSVFDATAAH